MAEGTHHIPRPGTSKSYCGAPYRKPTHNRIQPCPQCMRVKERKDAK